MDTFPTRYSFRREPDPNDRTCRCTNPQCSIVTIRESGLWFHFPHPKLVERISPGDTVPLGICPECRMPVYQPEDDPQSPHYQP